MRSVFCLLALLTFMVGFSQKKITLSDKEYNDLFTKVRILVNTDTDSALIVANRIALSENKPHKAFAFGVKSYLFDLKGDTLKSNLFYKQALNALSQLNSSNEKTKLEAYILNYRGLTYTRRGKFGEALKFYQKGMKLSQAVGDIIQIVKFNNNIATLNGEVENYRLAITAGKISEKIMNENQQLYDPRQFRQSKSRINYMLGGFYEGLYTVERKDKKILDTAEYHYKKAILYAKDFFNNRVLAQKDLANIYYLKKEYQKAENSYKSVLQITKVNNMTVHYCDVCYNLGDLYFETHRNKEALVFFKRVDSIYAKDQLNKLAYIRSNYYQSKIYKAMGENEKAYKHSEIYLKNFEEFESRLNAEVLNVNTNLSSQDLKKEMVTLQKDLNFAILRKKIIIAFGVFLILGLALFGIKQSRDKKRINEKVAHLIEEFRNRESNTDNGEDVAGSEIENSSLEKVAGVASVLNIDEEKEREILKKLKTLENKKEFLKPNFTLPTIAKKIKTNTTYLSYVVNKNFGKTFSEYSNELKINFVINEMINNSTYRKYSTQAIAESVGFKNAVSFTKSFSKRTGVSPTQFAKSLLDSDSMSQSSMD